MTALYTIYSVFMLMSTIPHVLHVGGRAVKRIALLIIITIGTHPNGASLRIICMKKQMKTLAKTVIIFHEKYNANIPSAGGRRGRCQFKQHFMRTIVLNLPAESHYLLQRGSMTHIRPVESCQEPSPIHIRFCQDISSRCMPELHAPS